MSLLRFVPASFLVFLLYANLAAQPGDIRLSPPIYRASIPNEARVQTAARLGDATLVVWGSGGNSGARDYGVLYGQIVRDGKALGTPRMITAVAFLTGYIQVLPLKDRFVVAWSDQRGATGSAYIQLVALDGTLIGGEAILHDRPISGLRLVRLGNALTLFWNDDRDGGTIYSRTIGEDGALDARTVERGRGVMEQGAVSAGIPGYTMIPRGDQLPLLFDEEGREIAAGSWTKKFAAPFHGNDDGSVATIMHDTLLLFRTALDTVPARKSIIPIVSGAVDGSQVLSRGEDGMLQLFYAVGRQNIAGYGEDISMLVVRSVESAGGSFGAPELLRRFTVARPDKNCQTTVIDSVRPERSRIGYNGYQVEIAFQGANVYECGGTYSSLPVSSSLRYFIRGGAFGTDSLPGATLPGDAPRVVRVNGLDSSVVLVDIGTGTIRLAAPSALASRDFAQLSPAIKVEKGELLMGWLSAEEDTVARLARWDYRKQGPALPLSAMSLASAVWAESGMTPLSWSHTIWGMEGQFLLEHRSRLKQSADSTGGPLLYRAEVFAPTLDGWKSVLEMESTPLVPRLGAAAFDPFTGETILGVRYLDNDGVAQTTNILAFDSLYRPVWNVDSIVVDARATLSIVPVKSNELIVADPSTITRYKDGAVMARYRPAYLIALYKRLLGEYMMRWEPSSPLTLTPFTLAGEMIKPRAEMLYQVPIIDPFITQNPADSTVIFLIGGTQGVRLIGIDRNLRLRYGPVYVSDSGHRAARPSGVFRGDTLFVVWEDYRYGFPLIYGRAVPLKRPAAAAGERFAERADAMTLMPLPANERFLALFPTPLRSGSTLEIADMTGTVRAAIVLDEGSASREIDIRELPPGTYFVRLRNAQEITVRPLVIVR